MRWQHKILSVSTHYWNQFLIDNTIARFETAECFKEIGLRIYLMAYLVATLRLLMGAFSSLVHIDGSKGSPVHINSFSPAAVIFHNLNSAVSTTVQRRQSL